MISKKIAFFSPHADPLAYLGSQQTGGQNIYEKELVEKLDKRGWEVDVFCRWNSLHKKQIVKFGKRSRVIRLKGGKIKYIKKEELMEVL